MRFVSRCLLFLSLLTLATASFAQSWIPISLQASNGAIYGASGSQFYTYSGGTQTILNASAPSDMVLCLERSDGRLMAIAAGGSASWQAVDATLTGVITTIASFPASANGDEPVCPALANDGNYYGTATTGGDYGYGYIYQLTAAGAINILFNFTNADGYGPSYPPVQASDGNLYWYSGDLLRYSQVSGMTQIPLGEASDNGSGPILEASDGNFYTSDIPYGSSGVLRISPAGATTIIYTPPPSDENNVIGYIDSLYLTGSTSQPLAVLQEYDYVNDDPEFGCSAYGNSLNMLSLSLAGAEAADYFDIGSDEENNGSGLAYADDYSLSLLLAGNGTFYVSSSDYKQTDDGEGGCDASTSYSYSTYAGGTPSITISLNQTHIKPGGTATATWSVTNAFSDTAQQCYGFNGLSGKLALSGSTTFTEPAAGTYTPAIICGGTQIGFAPALVAGNAALSLSSNATTATQGASVTLTATVTNPLAPTPTGKVNFMVGTTVVGSATLSNNVAKFTASTAGIPAGTYNVFASYVGDANYGAATSSPVTITVITKTATTITLSPASQTLLQGATVMLTAAVTGTTQQGAPTGSVKFMTGTTVVDTIALTAASGNTSDAVLSASTATIPLGTYTVTASYGGDSHNLPSNSNSVTVTIKDGTPVALAISPNPVAANASFTLKATVNGKDSPSGTVAFYKNGTTALASANVSDGVGQVTLPAGTLAAGTYQITAQYAGDANNAAGTSPTVSLTVQ